MNKELFIEQYFILNQIKSKNRPPPSVLRTSETLGTWYFIIFIIVHHLECCLPHFPGLVLSYSRMLQAVNGYATLLPQALWCSVCFYPMFQICCFQFVRRSPIIFMASICLGNLYKEVGPSFSLNRKYDVFIPLIHIQPSKCNKNTYNVDNVYFPS